MAPSLMQLLEGSNSFSFPSKFPPFSVGETGETGTIGWREIGHGALAESSLSLGMPPADVVPSSICSVSDIVKSNG
jgi:polyribonucleotide nucleotidyltransferase